MLEKQYLDSQGELDKAKNDLKEAMEKAENNN